MTKSSFKEIVMMDQEDPLAERGKAIRALEPKKAWPFTSGNLIVAFNTGLVGLVSNSFFRRMLMVRQGLVLSSLPMAAIPGITVTLMYPAFITTPILMGDINCPLCVSLRAGLMGLTIGAAYPFLMAAPLSASLAMRAKTMDIPQLTKNTSLQTVMDFWRKKMRYFKGQFITMAIFQMFTFAYVADRQFHIARTELNVGHPSGST